MENLSPRVVFIAKGRRGGSSNFSTCPVLSDGNREEQEIDVTVYYSDGGVLKSSSGTLTSAELADALLAAIAEKKYY